MFLFALTQGVSSASAELSNAWFANQLADQKVELNPVISHLNVQFYYLNWALDNVLTIFTALTQVDFLFASIIGSSIVTFTTTSYYFREKDKFRKMIQYDENTHLFTEEDIG
jgi:predicted PurR-regulated permease PerM